MILLRDETFQWGKQPQEKTLEEILPYSLVIIDKPCGPSSHEVAAYVKKILGLKKTGHSGTLDPEVSGVLPVLLEEATKAAGFLLKERKTYVAVMKLREPRSAKQIEAVFSRFRGKIYQRPPVKSAVRRVLRVREIFSLKVLEIDDRFVLFEAEVEAGTYIRKLCFDIGEVLGCGGLMAELRRTLSASFSEKQAVRLQQLSDAIWLWKEKNQAELLQKMLVPLEKTILLKKVVVSDGAIKPITSGADLAIPGICAIDDSIQAGDMVQVLSGKGELLCFAKALMSSDQIALQQKGIAFDIERVIRSYSLYSNQAVALKT